MSSLDDIIAADWEQRFVDWGTDAVYRRVAFDFDPHTQLRQETVVDTAVTVLLSGETQLPVPDAAGLDRVGEREFFLRLPTIAPHVPVPGDRIVMGESVHEIRRIDQVAHAPIVRLFVAKVA